MPERFNGAVSAPEAHPPWAEKTLYYIYIIFSKKLNKKYIGIKKNLRKRIWEHNNSKTPFTLKTKDWEIIYYEAFLSKQDAYTEEKFLKSGKGRDRLKYLLQNTIISVRRDAGVD